MFELILFLSVVITGSTILICKYVLKIPNASSAGAQEESQNSDASQTRQSEADGEALTEPWYLDFSKSFFPVLLLVFLLRGFIAEPFRIPSGSMLPTLEIGDFILVNKFAYGVRLPVIHKKVVDLSAPERGDIMVFRYPGDNKTNYIKRVVALPGDTVEYRYKKLFINGDLVGNIPNGTYLPFPGDKSTRPLVRFIEELPGRSHDILIDARSGSHNIRKVVPEGHYFVLGDNRDHSLDSRFWGFVPDKNVVGKAFFIWFHWNGHPQGGFKFSRIGTDI